MAPMEAGQVHFNTSQDFHAASKGSKFRSSRTKSKLISPIPLLVEAEVEDKSEAKQLEQRKTACGFMTVQQQRRATRLEALGVRRSLEISTATMSTMASMSNTSFPATGSTSSFPYSDEKSGLPTKDGSDDLGARGAKSKSVPNAYANNTYAQQSETTQVDFQGAPGMNMRRRGGSRLPLMVRPSIVDGCVQSTEWATYKSQGRQQRKKNMAWVSKIGQYGTMDTSEDNFDPKTENLKRTHYGLIKRSPRKSLSPRTGALVENEKKNGKEGGASKRKREGGDTKEKGKEDAPNEQQVQLKKKIQLTCPAQLLKPGAPDVAGAPAEVSNKPRSEVKTAGKPGGEVAPIKNGGEDVPPKKRLGASKESSKELNQDDTELFAPQWALDETSLDRFATQKLNGMKTDAKSMQRRNILKHKLFSIGITNSVRPLLPHISTEWRDEAIIENIIFDEKRKSVDKAVGRLGSYRKELSKMTLDFRTYMRAKKQKEEEEQKEETAEEVYEPIADSKDYLLQAQHELMDSWYGSLSRSEDNLAFELSTCYLKTRNVMMKSLEELTLDYVPTMLERMDRVLDEERIQLAVDTITRHRYTTINVSEWTDIYNEYVEVEWIEMSIAFDEVDTEGAMRVTRDGLYKILDCLNLFQSDQMVDEATFHVCKRLINSYTKEEARMTCAEVEGVIDYIRLRQGFSRREVADLAFAFTRFSTGHSQKMIATAVLGQAEMEQALAWMSYKIPPQHVAQIIARFDYYGRNSLRFPEFLKAMRICRTELLQELRTVFYEGDSDQNGRLDKEEFTEMVEKFGYYVDPVVINELWLIHVSSQEEGATLDEYESLHAAIHECQGLSRRILSRADDAFLKFSQSEMNRTGVRTIRVKDLDQALRWIGYPTTDPTLKDWMRKEVDSGDGKLDYRRYLRAVSMAMITELCEAKVAFQKYRKSSPHNRVYGLVNEWSPKSSKIELDDFYEAFKMSGMKSHEVSKITFEEFWELIECLRMLQMTRFQNLAGFSIYTAEKMRAKFDSYCADGEDYIEGAGSRKFLLGLFPEAENDLLQHMRAKLLLKDFDQNSNGRIEFVEYLHMMRLHMEWTNETKGQVEEETIDKLNFEQKEVKEFQTFFTSQIDQEDDEGNPMISGKHLLKMLTTSFQTIGPRRIKDVIGHVLKDADGVTFLGFLRLMRHLIDENFVPKDKKT